MPSDHLNSTIFRAALIVFMILGIPVIGALIYLNVQQVNQKPAEIEPVPFDDESPQPPVTQLETPQ